MLIHLHEDMIDLTEVDYEEMANLAKMDVEAQDEIWLQELLEASKQAKKDGYQWVWAASTMK